MDEQDREAHDASLDKRERLTEALTMMAVGIVGAGFMIWGLWSAGASIIGWLKSGVWTHPTLLEVGQRFGYDAPAYDWVIVQRAAMWFIGLPSGVVFICIGLCLISAAQKMEEEVSDRRLMARDRA